ncbi:uncharacterized protein LOC143551938 [Bidens hawaiensis]|uniref:uncharacterized protein LOC143551938 n=1 Tax=Bidens hawaiensis TaxID=980011 RepID=UPI00404AE233
MTQEDHWLTAAMADDDVVAELLLKLRLPTLPPQKWTLHQRRSRTQQPLAPTSNKSDTPRASPTTPLPWIGNTSKVLQHGETTPTKRPRKMKTLAALKEEEIVLTEEQNDLKKKIAFLQANCEKQRKENEKLKKIKMDIQVEAHGHFEVLDVRKDKTVLPDLNLPFGEDIIVSY